MKRFLIALLVCLSVSSAFASDNLAVVIYEEQGRTVFLLNRRPVASFTDTELKLVCGEETVLYPLAGYLKITIEETDAETALDDLYETGAYSITGQTITAYGCQHLWLYSTDGKLLATAEADDTGTASMSIGQLGKGIYLFKTENNTFKIIK